jgi:GMP synthase-like glutamine amidotransferase
MNIQVLPNISFEGPGYIEEISEKNGYELHVTRLFEGEYPFPPTDYDMLVIMGGPMNIYEENEYP